ncbi:amidohydrolase family protein [Nocardia grenadensis]|uniref:amidohydrolase family protein n=1 Tax=Nocardia grenadensis TaxID=931537 RepID=UPI0012EDE184|nr:amidohydrolase [Nocardia grenadensis]
MMFDRLLTADAAWLGGRALAGPTAIGVRGSEIGWIGPLSAAPAGARCAYIEGVLLPGLIDYHVHAALIRPEELLAAGVTTIMDLGWAPAEIWPLVERARHDPGLPHIHAAGPFLTAPGGYPSRQPWAPPLVAIEVDNPAAASRAVRSLVAHRPATIKVTLNSQAGPVVDDATLRSIVHEAGAHRIPVTAHTQGPGQTRRAQLAGVRVLAHTPWTETLDDQLISDLARDTTIISTIDIHGWGEPTPDREIALKNLRRFHRAGGVVRYGTDLGNGPQPPGVNAREIIALTDAGLNPADVLAAITGAPLRPGTPADLSVVPGDPLADPAVLGQARAVLKAGQSIIGSIG